MLGVYAAYLLPFHAIRSFVKWSDPNRLWFDIDLSLLMKSVHMNLMGYPAKGTMEDFYRCFFVPIIWNIVQGYQKPNQIGVLQ